MAWGLTGLVFAVSETLELVTDEHDDAHSVSIFASSTGCVGTGVNCDSKAFEPGIAAPLSHVLGVRQLDGVGSVFAYFESCKTLRGSSVFQSEGVL